MRESNPELHRQRVSHSLIGNKRRWLGDNASYYAKHMWILKYWGKADHCDFCHKENVSRYEWANKYHGESRNKDDYLQLCPSCHRKFDASPYCPRGHLYTPENTLLNCRGHRLCKFCLQEKRNATTN